MVVKDHPLFVEGIRSVLGAASMSVAAVAPTIADATVVADSHQPALAIVGISLPDGSGLHAVRLLLERNVPSLVVASHASREVVTDALRVGARGFVSKSAPANLLVEACKALLRGETYVCPDSIRALALGTDKPSPLTGRETEILALIARGYSNKEVAEQLGIAPRTVETHREHLLAKLDARNAADLTRAAIRLGLVRSA